VAGMVITCAYAVMLFTFGACSTEVDTEVQAFKQLLITPLWHRETKVRTLIPSKDLI
jgi:hypothetical protein